MVFQNFIIFIVFIISLISIGYRIFNNFKAKSKCATCVGSCSSIDFNKIEKIINKINQ